MSYDQQYNMLFASDWYWHSTYGPTWKDQMVHAHENPDPFPPSSENKIGSMQVIAYLRALKAAKGELPPEFQQAFDFHNNRVVAAGHDGLMKTLHVMQENGEIPVIIPQ